VLDESIKKFPPRKDPFGNPISFLVQGKGKATVLARDKSETLGAPSSTKTTPSATAQEVDQKETFVWNQLLDSALDEAIHSAATNGSVKSSKGRSSTFM